MGAGRDWRKTLHPASFKGVPFQTERDEEEGGRRIVTHEFPMRDVPFNEDLGEAKRDFDVTAYVASDNADGEADALVAVCSARGAGLLVLPMQGGVLVKLLTFRRAREKDRAGYVAFTLRFVREGAASSLVSIASLANAILVASDTAVSAVESFFAGAVYALGMPDFVVESAVNALIDGVAVFEAIRVGEAIDPTVSGAQRVAIDVLLATLPEAITMSAGVVAPTAGAIATVARGLAAGLQPMAAVRAFGQVMADATYSASGPYLTPASEKADLNKATAYLAIRVAAAAAYADAISQAVIPDRQTAIRLRADAAEYFGQILSAISASDFDLYRAVSNLSGATTEYLSRAILDRAPVVSVGANRRMPSLWWSYRLYQTPLRGTELVDRNRVIHPSFMPLSFDALIR